MNKLIERATDCIQKTMEMNDETYDAGARITDVQVGRLSIKLLRLVKLYKHHEKNKTLDQIELFKYFNDDIVSVEDYANGILIDNMTRDRWTRSTIAITCSNLMCMMETPKQLDDYYSLYLLFPDLIVHPGNMACIVYAKSDRTKYFFANTSDLSSFYTNFKNRYDDVQCRMFYYLCEFVLKCSDNADNRWHANDDLKTFAKASPGRLQKYIMDLEHMYRYDEVKVIKTACKSIWWIRAIAGTNM